MEEIRPGEPVQCRSGCGYPDEPEGSFSRLLPELPGGGISLLLDIQAIKSFKSIPEQGPHSQPGNIRIKSGDEGLRIKVWFDFQ